MDLRFVDSGWEQVLVRRAAAHGDTLRIVCPFIKRGALKRVIQEFSSERIEVITRFNMSDFAEGGSDIGALIDLVEAGARVRGVQNLHAKLYIFGDAEAVVTSANLTESGLERNHEFGCVLAKKEEVCKCIEYFNKLWKASAPDLTKEKLNKWIEAIPSIAPRVHLPDSESGLGDEGARVCFSAKLETVTPALATESYGANQSFIKFLGSSKDRAPLTKTTLEELDSSGCHWALCYPASKRPTGVLDGAVMYIGRMTADRDIRVIGRGIAKAHDRETDVASREDLGRHPWKKRWPMYIRIRDTKFIDATLGDCVSLKSLMDDMKSRAFSATKRNAASSNGGNIDPRKSIRRQAGVELSREGEAWLEEKFEEAIARHGTLSSRQMGLLWGPDRG